MGDSTSIEGMADEPKKGRKKTAAEGRRTPPALSAAERDERNATIVRMRLRNLPWSFIAEQNNLTVRQCQNVWAECRAEVQSVYVGMDAVEIVHDMLARYEVLAEEFAMTAEKATSDSAKVGALNSQLMVMRTVSAICQDVGILPRDLGTLRVVVDIRQTVQRVVKVLNENGVSVEVQQEIMRAVAPERHALPVGELPAATG